jgi:hypothetical protein
VTYQRARRARGQRTVVAPGGVYRELLAAGLRRGQLARVAASQVAYAAGLVSGLLRARSSVASRTSVKPRAS